MNEQDKKAVRVAFGEALLQLGEEIPELVVLDADISSSLQTGAFAQRYPERHINFGVAEQNMLISAAGLATTQLIPLACTYATFASMRACEQIRSFICYGNLNVKIIASHGGIEVGWDGPTHQAIEDIAITRAMPNIRVVVPADAVAATALLRQAVTSPGPVYFRMGRNPVPIIYDSQQSFTLGKAIQLRQGPHLTLIAVGVMVSVALQVASKLACKGIQATVLDMHTIKPLDHEALLNVSLKTPLLVTLEDHSIIGGLGSAVAEVISEIYPRKIIRIGIPDTFSESGDPQALFQAFKMDADSITERIFHLFQTQ